MNDEEMVLHMPGAIWISLSGPVLLKDSVMDIYDSEVTFGNNLMLEGKAENLTVATDLESLDCLAEKGSTIW